MLTLDDANASLLDNFGARRRVNANEPAEWNAATTQRRGAILFGEFRLVPATRTLTRNGSPVHLGARALDILIALLERAGQIVSKAELFAIVWPTTCVEESNLRVQLSALRRALGDGRSGTRFILNVAGRGYLFVGEVERTWVGRSVESIPLSATAA
jgi:DNA-binding winged helix-turn-helix (wHTH) protein